VGRKKGGTHTGWVELGADTSAAWQNSSAKVRLKRDRVGERLEGRYPVMTKTQKKERTGPKQSLFRSGLREQEGKKEQTGDLQQHQGGGKRKGKRGLNKGVVTHSSRGPRGHHLNEESGTPESITQGKEVQATLQRVTSRGEHRGGKPSRQGCSHQPLLTRGGGKAVSPPKTKSFKRG